MKVHAWVDVTCPYCWLGKHHLEEAIRQSGIQAEVEYMAFELDPHRKGSVPVATYLAGKYGDSSRFEAAHEALAAAGAKFGLDYDFERSLVTNTFDAHRLHNLAKSRGLGPQTMECLMRARQAEGEDLSDHDTLVRLAVEAGLPEADVRAMLADPEAHAEEVRHEEALAREVGVRGVPFFVFDQKLAVVGAQPVERIAAAMKQVAAATPDLA